MSVEIRPVAGRRDLRRFIRLPVALYRNEPRWIPPLLSDMHKRLDRQHNPFFAHAEAEFFLAWRDGEPVGRISAHIDHRFNEFQDNQWGLFGFFECEDSQPTAHALLDAARPGSCSAAATAWSVRWTTRPTTSAACWSRAMSGRRSSSRTWHHPYYQELLEEGLEKVMDLLMWSLHISGRDRVRRRDLADGRQGRSRARDRLPTDAQARHGRRGQPLPRGLQRRLGAQLGRGPADRGGDSPLRQGPQADPRRELGLHRRACRHRRGRRRGADAARLQPGAAHLHGRLLPIGWAKALYWRRKIDAVRVFALGVKPAYQHTGIAARFYQLHFDAAERTPQKGGEMGWILETNRPMNRAMEGMGGEIVRRFRVYERCF
jgi:hypothetical protein